MKLHIQKALTLEDALTPRELDVLKEIVKGRTNAQIAHALQLSFETIKTYLNRLRAKMGVGTRAELVEKYELYTRPAPKKRGRAKCSA